jgi:hypothetical protein
VTNVRFEGVIASPFQLKMQALADYAQCEWQRWPDQAPSVVAAWRNQLALQLAKRRGTVERYPERHTHLDEYPGVPYYQIDDGPFYYDSSSFAYHLDALEGSGQPLIPIESELNFMAHLIDEAFDEFGLYIVHHMRWAGTARTTTMPEITARELRKIYPRLLHKKILSHLPERQSRRCPYLFSVAPEGFDLGLPSKQTPPAMPGFPETHNLLNHGWRAYLAAMESLLHQQPYLLGERFTLADASAYGQLSMNLIDGAPADLLHELAPKTFDWLCAIRDGKHRGANGQLYLSNALKPLLEIIGKTFVPLMQQNAVAYEQAIKDGETLFNEAAFDRGRALYNGELMGYPFRAVVKTFQVRVWYELKVRWQGLTAGSRDSLQAYVPLSTRTALADQSGLERQ